MYFRNILTKLNGCFTLFATHFSEMTQLDQKYSGVKNMHLKAILDKETKLLTMLYKVENGYSDKSFGLHVANITKFPNQVLNSASQKLNCFENNCNILILLIYLVNIHNENFKNILKSPSKLGNFIEKLKLLKPNDNHDDLINQIINVVNDI